jgi:hypothetical protein
MSKNSRDPKGRQAPSDGAISTAELPPSLKPPDAGPIEVGGVGGSRAEELSLLLDDVNEAALPGLAVGQAVRFSEAGRRLAARVDAGTLAIGIVPSRHAEAVRRAVAVAYTAWISELPHKAVRVTVRW